MSAPPRAKWTHEDYERAAQAFADSLTLEDEVEATPHNKQCGITEASLSIVRLRNPRLHYFGDLLVQAFFEGRLRQICADNMVVIGDLAEVPRTSFITEEEPAPIFWVLEYVSPKTRDKDYEANFGIYQTELRIPYY